MTNRIDQLPITTRTLPLSRFDDNVRAAQSSAEQAAISAQTAADLRNQTANLVAQANSVISQVPRFFDSAQEVLSDTEMTYSDVSAGQPIYTASGVAYEVAADGAADAHVATAGGVDLYVLPDLGVYRAEAFGLSEGNTAVENSEVCQKALDVALAAGGGDVFIPPGSFDYSGLYVPPGVHLRGASASLDPFSGDPGTRLILSSSIQYFGEGVPATGDEYLAGIYLKNGPVGGRGGAVSNLVIDIAGGPAICYGIQLAGVWHANFENIYVRGVDVAGKIGVYSHVEDEGSYWNTFRNVRVEGDPSARLGTGWRLGNDNPNDGSSPTGRTNQTTLVQCAAHHLTDGFVLDGCGAGIRAETCQAESIEGTCVTVRNNSAEGYPLWTGGEVNGNGSAGSTVGFDGRIRVVDCSTNTVATDFQSGAIAEDLYRLGCPHLVRTGVDSVATVGLGGGEGNQLLSINSAFNRLGIPADTPTTLMVFPAPAVGGHGVMSLYLMAVNEATRFRNTRAVYTFSFRFSDVTLDLERSQGVNQLVGLDLSASEDSGFISLDVVHQELAGDVEVYLSAIGQSSVSPLPEAPS